MALLFKNSNIEQLLNNSNIIINKIIEEKNILLTLYLIDNFKEFIPIFLNNILLINNNILLKFYFLKIFLKFFNINLINNYLLEISKFVWLEFKKGGMNLIIYLLNNNLEISNHLLIYNNFEILFNLILNDFNNNLLYLLFLNYSLNKIFKFLNENNFETLLFNLYLLILKFENDQKKGFEIIKLSIKIIIFINSNYNIKNSFLKLIDRQKQIIINILNQFLIKFETKKKIHSLKVFSTNKRILNNNEDELNNLEIDE